MIASRLALLLASTALLGGCTGVIFQPERKLRLDPADHGVEYRNIRFRASDGVALHGWLFPAVGETVHGTVVLAHGNGGNVSSHAGGVAWLREHGYNVFAFDYRGYGRSEGTPTMVGVHRDTVAAIRTADRHDELPRDRIALVGQSLGGAIATVTAARLDDDEAPGALVVDSAPSDYRDIAQEKLAAFWLTWPFQVPLSWLVTSDFAAVDAVGQLPPIPKLFIGNRNDRTVPFHHTRRLSEAAAPPRTCWRIADERHLATFTDEVVRARFVAWLDSALAGDRSGLGADSADCPPED